MLNEEGNMFHSWKLGTKDHGFMQLSEVTVGCEVYVLTASESSTRQTPSVIVHPLHLVQVSRDKRPSSSKPPNTAAPTPTPTDEQGSDELQYTFYVEEEQLDDPTDVAKLFTNIVDPTETVRKPPSAWIRRGILYVSRIIGATLAQSWQRV
jgi:hypothetical protein